MHGQHFVNWQVSFTEHQVHTWRAISSQCSIPSFTVISSALSATRKEQGWSEPIFDPLIIYRLSRYYWLFQAIKVLYSFRGSVHVFCGFWNDRRYIVIYTMAALAGIRVCIANESFGDGSFAYFSDSKQTVGSRIKKHLKPLAYKSIALYLRAIAWLHPIRIIAFSSRASTQFELAGFEARYIIPFGYFVQKVGIDVNLKSKIESLQSRSNVRIIYVGSLLKTKGLDIAIEAVRLARFSGAKVTLDIFGPGDPSKYVSPDEEGINYCGVIPFGKSQCVIKDYDALVLPSRHDGWGVVTNEAILAGVPVIVSDHAGSACIIENSGAGAVFESENVAELSDLFRSIDSTPSILENFKSAAKALQADIDPKNAAAYFIKAVHDSFAFNTPAPECPWS